MVRLVAIHAADGIFHVCRTTTESTEMSVTASILNEVAEMAREEILGEVNGTMSPEELSAELTRMCRNAPEGEVMTMVLLFGVRYADDLAECGESANQIARRAAVPDAHGREVQKGMKLARYVCEKR